MEKREVMGGFNKPSEDKETMEAVSTDIYKAYNVGFLDGVDTMGRWIIFSGCLLVLTSWVGRRFL